jgi:thioredoxin-like negative regulator of GroEL
MSITESAPAPTHDGTPSEPVRLAFFYSPKSGRSRRAEGFLAQVLQHRGNHNTFKLLRVDVDERPDLASRFRVTTIPTLLVISDNRVQARLTQPTGCRQISQLLSPWLR